MNKKGKYNSPWKATFQGIKDLYGQKKKTVQLPQENDLAGKTVLVTGASSGLGYAAALRMAQEGAHIIMAVRSGIPEKGIEISRLSGNSNVRMYHVDLADFVSIDQLIEKLQQDGVQIDIMVSNAAMVALQSRKTPQGLEEMFMVNYLSAFYLINRLLEENMIRESPQETSRIIIVSSESHRNTEGFEWKQIGQYHEYGMKETVARYGYFKLLLTTFAHELNQRLQQSNRPIIVKALCPGPVNSNIAREAPTWMKPLLKIVFSLFFRSPQKAADPILYFAIASLDEMEENHVEYLFLMEVKDMDDKATTSQNGQKLWEQSERLIQEIVTKQ